MKRIALILALVLVLTSIMSIPAFAETELPLRVVVNNREVSFPDAKPFIDENGRTQVPVRFVSEALGADVKWENDTRKVTVSMDGKKVVLAIGSSEYYIDDQKKQMDTKAVIKETRTFVPVRFVTEALGATVEWDNAVRTVYIEIKEGSKSKDKTGTRDVAGFIVPNDIDLMVASDSHSKDEEVSFLVDFLRPNVEKQKDDLEKILMQKLSEDTVKEIMAYVRQKVNATDTLEAKLFYDTKTKQYIAISKSWPIYISDINIAIFKKGIKPY